MNKKIWILLASLFLVLVLVLGIQMLNSGPTMAPAATPEPEEERASEASPYVEDQPTNTNIVQQSNPGTPEVEPEDSAETPEEPTTVIEPETTIEPDAQAPTEATEAPTEITPTKDNTQYITLSVSAKTLLDKKDTMNPEKWELVPADGMIFPTQKVEFTEGESVFNVLLREMKKNKIHMEYIMAPIYNSNYIEGIGNLYEFDCGELSGWMYAVNDLAPNLGTSNHILKDGDTVKLLYTCDLGRDLGFQINE